MAGVGEGGFIDGAMEMEGGGGGEGLVVSG